MTVLLFAMAFVAGWAARALRVYFADRRPALEPPDRLAEALIEEMRSMLSDLYKASEVSPELQGELMASTMPKIRERVRQMEIWRSVAPAIAQAQRPLVEDMARIQLEAARKIEMASSEPREGWDA